MRVGYALCFITILSQMILSYSAEEKTNPNVFEFLKKNRAKRSPDYYYDDYDYDDIIVRTSSPRTETRKQTYATRRETTPKPSTDTPFQGFDDFIYGLVKLQAALDNPDYDWSKKAVTPETALTSPDLPSQNTTDSSGLHDLLVLVEVLKQLSNVGQITTTTPVSTDELLIQAQMMLDSISRALAEDTDAESRREILATIAPSGREPSAHAVVDEVSKLFQKTFGDPTVSLPPVDMSSFDGPSLLLNMTVVLLQNAKDSYEAQSSSRSDDARQASDSIYRLEEVIRNLHQLSEGLIPQTTTTEATTTETPKPIKTAYKQCTAPYVEIAYKICILPVLDQQLSWSAAKEYCRSKGSTLALDPAVVKGRRFLNDLLGESGTRERWTIWIGAKKSEDDGRWYFDDGLKVPGFLWNKGQPRTYSTYSLPSGTCMALDGFAEYYGTALPCHNRRRFVCQRH